ncbi:MAG: hypothetical protein JST30_13360 [Armatimonadetes bacterium]|nr:hypothetical protein [Armatimonadota bacterium]
MRKLSEEQPMTPDVVLALDEALEASAGLGKIVHDLPDPEPSLAWRSKLNGRLLAVSPKKRRTAVWTWLSGGVAATALAAFAFVSLSAKPPAPERPDAPNGPVAQASAGLEESLLTAHNDANLESGLGVAWTQEAPKPRS